MFGKDTRASVFVSPRFGIVLAILLLPSAATQAGGGPENVFLVVNPQSPDSLAIANSYQHWRQIPPGNVFYLPWKPDQPETDVDDFRRRILTPILDAIRARRLSGQIDYIVYSCDFPWRISLDADTRKFCGELGIPTQPPPEEQLQGKSLSPAKIREFLLQTSSYGSLTGLTYLHQLVVQPDKDYLDLHSNYYLSGEPKGEPSARGFRHQAHFGPDGESVPEKGRSYFLSVMLGVTFGRGNTREEILRYLERSAPADGTQPKGTIYFVKNSDIRSQVRHDMYPAVVDALKKLGVQAEILSGTVPLNRSDVQGAMLGVSDFDWKATQSTILPGAICDHFTSYGGIFIPTYGQTPLSEFLRYGAAGSSGTVVEPRAMLFKFPLPLMQVYYARGCTLAEAYYQAVASPYQLLIVGDPLCRPWAKIPQVSVRGVQAGVKVKGALTLDPQAVFPAGGTVDHFELFVNGSRAVQCRPGKTLSLDTRLLPDGWQEFRVVAVESGAIQTQGRAILAVQTENLGRSIDARLTSGKEVAPDRPLKLEVASPGSTKIVVLQNSRVVGGLSGDRGKIEIAASALGAGPVRLSAIGLGASGPQSHVLSQPIDVVVTLPADKKVGEKTPQKAGK
jgi:hypothetical protein